MSYAGFGATATTGAIQGERVLSSTIQAWLKALGYNVRIDAVWGAQTDGALQQYARTKGRSVLYRPIENGRAVVFPYNDELLKSLRLEGSTAASSGRRPPPGATSPVPEPDLTAPVIDITGEQSFLTRDSLISGVPNWAILGGGAAVAGGVWWYRKRGKRR